MTPSLRMSQPQSVSGYQISELLLLEMFFSRLEYVVLSPVVRVLRFLILAHGDPLCDFIPLFTGLFLDLGTFHPQLSSHFVISLPCLRWIAKVGSGVLPLYPHFPPRLCPEKVGQPCVSSTLTLLHSVSCTVILVPGSPMGWLMLLCLHGAW